MLAVHLPQYLYWMKCYADKKPYFIPTTSSSPVLIILSRSSTHLSCELNLWCWEYEQENVWRQPVCLCKRVNKCTRVCASVWDWEDNPKCRWVKGPCLRGAVAQCIWPVMHSCFAECALSILAQLEQMPSEQRTTFPRRPKGNHTPKCFIMASLINLCTVMKS